MQQCQQVQGDCVVGGRCAPMRSKSADPGTIILLTTEHIYA